MKPTSITNPSWNFVCVCFVALASLGVDGDFVDFQRHSLLMKA